MKKKIEFSLGLKLVLLVAAAFLAGRSTGMAVDALSGRVQQQAEPAINEGGALGGKLQQETQNWGLSFREEGKPPVADVSGEELAKYNACYIENTEEKAKGAPSISSVKLLPSGAVSRTDRVSTWQPYS